MDFYVNKYKIRKPNKPHDDPEFIPAGTVFTIHSMAFDVLDLKPINKINDVPFIPVTASLLNFGFTLTEHIENND